MWLGTYSKQPVKILTQHVLFAYISTAAWHKPSACLFTIFNMSDININIHSHQYRRWVKSVIARQSGQQHSHAGRRLQIINGPHSPYTSESNRSSPSKTGSIYRRERGQWVARQPVLCSKGAPWWRNVCSSHPVSHACSVVAIHIGQLNSTQSLGNCDPVLGCR